MTKEELKQEAGEYTRKIRHDVINWGGKEPEERFYNEIKFKQAYLAGAEFGYNKANEWHFVKDELPNEGTYLVVWQNDKGYKEIFTLNYEEDNEEELHWVDGDCEVQDEYIIAWKEIVPPKEIKKLLKKQSSS